MSEKNGGPAFPTIPDNHSAGIGYQVRSCGMTLRDYFAAKAMQAMVSTVRCEEEVQPQPIAIDAYKMADAMLKERNEPQSGEQK